MTEEKKEEQTTPQIIGPWIELRMNQQTGRVMIKSNLDHWWRVIHMLALALHSASDMNVKKLMQDEKKILVSPPLGGLTS